MNTNNKARRIFLEAIAQHAPEKRAEFIATVSDGDVNLRMHVERLLHSQQIFGSFHENGLPVEFTFDQPATDYLGTHVLPRELFSFQDQFAPTFLPKVQIGKQSHVLSCVSLFSFANSPM